MPRGDADLLVVLSDGVVLLRPPTTADIPLITAGCRHPDAARWTTVPQPYSEADAAAFLALRPTASEWWAAPLWAITSGDDQWGGSIDLRLDDAGGAEVGYMVAPWLRGRGVATRALLLVCRWGFTALDLQVIRWFAIVGNDASRALAERVGFRVHREPLRRAVTQRGTRRDAWVGDLIPGDLTESAAARRAPWAGPPLTTREREVLSALAMGDANRDVAQRLGISENTVKNHVRAILEKLGAKSRMEAVVKGVQQGLTHLP